MVVNIAKELADQAGSEQAGKQEIDKLWEKNDISDVQVYQASEVGPKQPVKVTLFIRCIYDSIEELRRDDNTLTIQWRASVEEDGLLKQARAQEREATPQAQFPAMKLTTLNAARSKCSPERVLPEEVGRFQKWVDKALPGSMPANSTTSLITLAKH
ncbi:reverse transcriptase [Colletotrichum tofieldiae]|uniref:Reverse transcriptase n=1 Tax=Colletotrichum tofieldiae TaxID=708197 RepID=A0A166LWZ2_9PEZI|nr:reverse transcriptase [Colletotrichum tofieldiae]